MLFTGEETRASDIACPAQVEGEVSFPWSEGDRCFEWQSSAEPESLDAVCPEDLPPKGPGAAYPCRERLPEREVHTGHEKDGPRPPSPAGTTSHYQNNGWARYAECNLIRAQLTPPVHVICRGRSGQPLPPRASSPCVVRLPVRSLSFRLTCQLQGECVDPEEAEVELVEVDGLRADRGEQLERDVHALE